VAALQSSAVEEVVVGDSRCAIVGESLEEGSLQRHTFCAPRALNGIAPSQATHTLIIQTRFWLEGTITGISSEERGTPEWSSITHALEALRTLHQRVATGAKLRDTHRATLELLALWVAYTPVAAREATPSQPSHESSLPRLTPRQCEVLALLFGGLQPRDISRRLVITETSVRMHIRLASQALGASGGHQAAVKAYRLGSLAKELEKLEQLDRDGEQESSE